MSITSDKVSIPSDRGHELAGHLQRVDGTARGGVILAHCFTCSKDLRGMREVADTLHDRGYHVLRFDFTGLGESEGEFRDATFATDVRDIISASIWMMDQGLGPCAFVGHSLGGAATLVAASRVKTVQAIVTIGAPADAAHVRHLIPDDAADRARTEGCSWVELAGRPFEISDNFLDALEKFDGDHELAKLDMPNLVLHAPADDTVEVSEGERIFSATPQPSGFLPLKDADHLLLTPGSGTQAGELAANWFDRWVNQ